MTLTSYQTRIKNIQTNLLSYAFILTSNRDNAYRLLRDTNSALINRHNDYSGEMSMKEWSFGIMQSIFSKKYSGHVGQETMKSRCKVCYHLDIDEAPQCVCAIEEKTLTAEINSMQPEQAAVYRLHVTGYRATEICDRLKLAEYEVHDRLAKASRHISAKLAEM